MNRHYKTNIQVHVGVAHVVVYTNKVSKIIETDVMTNGITACRENHTVEINVSLN